MGSGSWSRVKRCRRGPQLRAVVGLFAMRPALTAKVGWSRVKDGEGGSMCFMSLASRRGKYLRPVGRQEDFHYSPP